MHRLEELKIWRKSMNLTGLVYKLAKQLPQEEKFGLSNQINRSAISIASNIAEGAGRNSNNEFRHFLSIANGSAYELQTQLILQTELNLIDTESVNPILNLLNEILKMNFSLQKSISDKESQY